MRTWPPSRSTRSGSPIWCRAAWSRRRRPAGCASPRRDFRCSTRWWRIWRRNDSRAGPASGGIHVRHPRRKRRVDPTQLGEGLLGFRELAFEQGDLFQALFPAEPERVTRRLAAAGRDHFANLGEREAELLGLENDREAVGIPAPVAPMAALAAGAEQSAALVEAQRAQGYVELPGKVPDRIDGFVPVRVGRISGAFDPKNVVRPGEHLRRIAVGHSHSSCGRSRVLCVTYL